MLIWKVDFCTSLLRPWLNRSFMTLRRLTTSNFVKYINIDQAVRLVSPALLSAVTEPESSYVLVEVTVAKRHFKFKLRTYPKINSSGQVCACWAWTDAFASALVHRHLPNLPACPALSLPCPCRAVKAKQPSECLPSPLFPLVSPLPTSPTPPEPVEQPSHPI